jgi:hypothetical protein
MPDHEFYCYACMKTFSKVLTRTNTRKAKSSVRIAAAIT